MKKIIAVLLTACIALSLAACSGSRQPDTAATTELNVLVVSDLEPLEPVFLKYAESNGIQINVESVPYAEIFNTIEVRLGGHESTVDVLVADAPLVANYAAKGYLGSMSPYIDNESLTHITEASLAGGTVDGEIIA